MQHALWVTSKRFAYVPAARQSGKTELAMRRLVRYLPLKKPWSDPRYVFAGPTYKQIKRVAWRRLLSLTPRHWVEDVNLGELTIRTIFGSELSLIGLDRPERIEGVTLDGVVLDECSDIKPGTFDLSILPTLVWRDGWCWFVGIPKRFGIGAVEYRTRYEAAVAGTLPNSAGFTWPSSDIIPSELLEYARSTMSERDFEEQFLGTWLSASGGVFYSFDRQYNVRPCSYSPELPILVGADFNVNPLCFILAHLSGDTLLVFDEIWLRNSNTPEALKVLLARYKDHKGGFQIYGDASSRGRRTSAYDTDYAHIANNVQLKSMGRTMHISKSNPPQADRFAVTNARICDGEGNMHVYIDSRCTHLINDLEIRAFKPGSREVADHGDIGHSSDALGYILFKKWPLNLRLPGSSNIITITEGPK